MTPERTKTKIVFISDYFAEDFVGGAELTSQALIEVSPFEIIKIRAIELNGQHISQHADKLWIFGNFSQMKYTLIPEIMSQLLYVVLEYDYKFCMHRSVDLHAVYEGDPCDCHKYFGKTIANFFKNSQYIFWMSEAQKKIYEDRFLTLREAEGSVLSSVFSDDDINALRDLRNSDVERSGWAYQSSGSWIKGIEDAAKYCADNGLLAKPLLKMKRVEFLKAIRGSEGFVFMPKGGDSCPRIVIEAKLLGCKLALNNNVQHKNEEWFNLTVDEVEEYLSGRSEIFWNKINSILSREAANVG